MAYPNRYPDPSIRSQKKRGGGQGRGKGAREGGGGGQKGGLRGGSFCGVFLEQSLRDYSRIWIMTDKMRPKLKPLETKIQKCVAPKVEATRVCSPKLGRIWKWI